MLTDDQLPKKRKSKHQGYISSVCFLTIFFAAFVLIGNVMRLVEEQYNRKLMEFKSLQNLSTYDVRADLYAILRTSTETIDAFDEDVFINNNSIYLDEMREIYIQRGE